MKNISIILCTLLVSLTPTILSAQVDDDEIQADSCYRSNPFCTGTSYEFPASVDASAEQGPYYGCLRTQPNPAWYHMRIKDPGNINIKIYTNPSKDVDFICWGPFDDPFLPCENNLLTSDKEIDCSYSPNHQEMCNIPGNSQTGEYYILLLTNYSNDHCNILFEKIDGNGTTDCGILPSVIEGNAPLCCGETLELTTNTINGATFQWEGPNDFNSTEQNIVIPNVTEAHAGEYSLIISLNGQVSDPSFYQVVVNPLPDINAGEDVTVPYGTTTQLNGQIADPNTYNYDILWTPSDKVDNPTILNPNTIILEESVEYNLQVTNKESGCKSEDNKNVTVTGGSLESTIIVDESEICIGKRVQLKAQTSGGSGNYTYSWTSSPEGFTSDIYNPYVEPQETTTYIVNISDGYNEIIAEKTILVNPLPDMNAGEDFSIPYGTSTQLNASVSSGTAPYTYHWIDDTFLNENDILNPTTKNIYFPTEFNIEVVDIKGCKSTDNVYVSLTGTALSTNINVSSEQVCLGETSSLKAIPSGGSENYSYTWKIGEDIISEEQELTITPPITTTYTLFVNDGFNEVSQDIKIIVNPLPILDLIPTGTTIIGIDTVEVCVNDTIILDATQSDQSSYLWENGSIEPTKEISSSGLAFSLQSYNVLVENSFGCINTAEITLAFTYNACDLILELNPDAIQVYPVPVEDILNLEINDFNNDVLVEISDITGKKVYCKTFTENEYHSNVIGIDLAKENIINGTYVVSVTDKSIKVRKKIVVNR